MTQRLAATCTRPCPLKAAPFNPAAPRVKTKHMDDTFNTLKRKGVFNILSIDGGGSRGLISLMLLKELMDALKSENNGVAPHPTEVFDLFTGTSSGGIAALGLTLPDCKGNPKYSVDDLIARYEAQVPDLFQPKVPFLPVPLVNLFTEKYRAAGLSAMLEADFGEARLGAALKPVRIPSYEINSRQTYLFTSDGPYQDLKMKDVAQATSSAPTYFPAKTIDDITPELNGKPARSLFVDGGVYLNNASLAAYLAARGIKLDPGVKINVISLGAGSFKQPIQNGHLGLMGWAPQIYDVSSSGDSETALASARAFAEANHDQVFRFQAAMPEPIPLDASTPDQIRKIKAVGEAAIQHLHNGEVLDEEHQLTAAFPYSMTGEDQIVKAARALLGTAKKKACP